MSDREWETWKKGFVAAKPSRADAAALSARVDRETRKQWVSLAIEIIAGALVIAFYVVIILRGPVSGPVVALAGGSFAFVAIWLGYLVHVRRATWRAPGTALSESLAIALARRRADVRWFGFARRSCVALGVAAAAWAPFMLAAHREVYAAEPWRAAVGFGGIYAILAVLFRVCGKRLVRARTEEADLAAARDALAAEDAIVEG